MSLRIVSGDEQQGTIGTELPNPIVVQALNSKGKALKGQLVNFVVVEGGGSVYAGSSITDQHGVAQEYWTLGPELGSNRLEVRAVDPTTGQKQNFATLTAMGRPVPVSRVVVTPSEATFEVGQNVEFVVTLFDAAGNELAGREVTWTSGNTAIATVEAGFVMGRAIGGPITITAASEGRSAAAQVTILSPRVSFIQIEPSFVELAVGQTTQLAARTYDALGNLLTGREVVFVTYNETFGSVTPSGLVTAGNRDGHLEVYAHSGSVTSDGALVVVRAPIASMTITPASAQVLQGVLVDLAADLRDAAGNPISGRAVSWTSSDPAVASVFFDGVQSTFLSTHAGGTVTITATIESFTATAVITVVALNPDQYEPNDVSSTAYVLDNLLANASELVINPTFHSTDDRDWFRLTAVEANDACAPGTVQNFSLRVLLSEMPGNADYDLEVRLGSEDGPSQVSRNAFGDEEIVFNVAGTCGVPDTFVFLIKTISFFSPATNEHYRLGMTFTQ
jgi:uncharacterized protein YjdB